MTTIYDADDEAIAAWLAKKQNESTINSFSLTKHLKRSLYKNNIMEVSIKKNLKWKPNLWH
jgi:hypothetical protein